MTVWWFYLIVALEMNVYLRGSLHCLHVLHTHDERLSVWL